MTCRVIQAAILMMLMAPSTASATTPTCSAAHCPDLVGQVVSYTFPLSLGCDKPLQGDFTITVCVRNEGDAPAGPFHVSANGYFFDEFDVDGLSAGVEDCQLRPLLTIGGYGVLNVDSRNEVVESNEDNNSNGFFVASLSATPSCTPTGTPTATPTPTPTVQVQCTPPLCQPGEVFYCPGDCPGGCGTQCATPTPTATYFPQCDFSPVPSAGPPGTSVSLGGLCYPIHSGRTASVYFDSILMATIQGDTGGYYSTGFMVPEQASIGDHRVTLVMSNSVLLATATFTVVSSCHGDCGGDSQVTIDELITMVNIALNGESGGLTCPGIDQWCAGPALVTVTCIIEAVHNALFGCPGPTPTPAVTLDLHVVQNPGAVHIVATLTNVSDSPVFYLAGCPARCRPLFYRPVSFRVTGPDGTEVIVKSNEYSDPCAPPPLCAPFPQQISPGQVLEEPLNIDGTAWNVAMSDGFSFCGTCTAEAFVPGRYTVTATSAYSTDANGIYSPTATLERTVEFDWP